MTTQARITGIPGQDGKRLAERLLYKSDEVRNRVGRTTIYKPSPVRVLVLPRRCRRPKSPQWHRPVLLVGLTSFFVVKTVHHPLQDVRMKRHNPPMNQFPPINILLPAYNVARYLPIAMESISESYFV